MNDDDRTLARRLVAGDERAFDVFFEEYFPPLFRFAVPRVAGNEDAAEEVAQATLCKAVRKLGTYRGEAALLTWLCTFCRHEISAHWRARGRTGEPVELVEDEPAVRAALDSIGAGLERPDDAAERREIARLVQVALDRLPPRYGNALEWKYLDDIPVREIAARLALSPKAAESLLTRARDAFRDAFSILTNRETAT